MSNAIDYTTMCHVRMTSMKAAQLMDFLFV